jgi:phospholipase/carboxylesterase
VSDLDLLVHRLRPAAEAPEGALVLLHGRGADEHDLYPLLDLLDPQRRRLGVTARAPLSLPPGGAHWYVVRQVGYPDPETFSATYAALTAWVDALPETLGVPPERIALGGFSQGAVMTYALALGRDRPSPPAAIALSGFIPEVDGFELDLESRTGMPVAIGHGTYDPVIGVEFGRAATQRLERAGLSVVYRESPMAHSVDPGFLEDLRPWLGAAVNAAARPGSTGAGGP